MAKSKQTFEKNEREKKKKRKREEKLEKKAQRKANSKKGASLESMMAYVDHNGQLTDTPPDPKLKVEIKAEDILLGPRSFIPMEESGPRKGRVALWFDDKRYGFIKDSISQEKIFFHFSQVNGEVKEGDNVTFETARGPKGLNAVNVKPDKGS